MQSGCLPASERLGGSMLWQSHWYGKAGARHSYWHEIRPFSDASIVNLDFETFVRAGLQDKQMLRC